MGGDINRLTKEEQAALARSQEKMPKSMNLDDWMAHVQEHGTSVMMENHKLMDQAGAYDERKAQQQAKEDARRALMAQDRPEPTETQRAVIEALPEGPLRDHVRDSLRTALVFDPVLRPATSDDMSFTGGLPVAPKSLEWPTVTARDLSLIHI